MTNKCKIWKHYGLRWKRSFTNTRTYMHAQKIRVYIFSLTWLNKFTYVGSCVSSTENDINMRQAKACTAIDRLSIIWKSDLSDKMKHNFFQVVVVSLLLYGCTPWTLTKRIEKKARWELLKKTKNYIEQIFEVTSHESAAVRLPIS